MTDTVRPEEGKSYTDRNGTVWGPMCYDHKTGTDYVWDAPGNDSGWNADGALCTGHTSVMDLIAEWVEPVNAREDGEGATVQPRPMCELGFHHKGFDGDCNLCGATPDQVNAQARAWVNPADPLPDDIKAQIADEAKRIVSGARRSAYGTPEQNFDRIARYWDAYFKNSGRDVSITAADVSPMMALMKIARLGETPDHYDSMVDLVGYTLTMAEVNKVQKPG